MSQRMLVVVSLLVPLSLSSFAQNKPVQASDPNIAEVIKRFAAAESENRLARNNYTFTQDFEVQELGEANSVIGRFKRTSDIVFDDRSNRFEKITYFPSTTLPNLQISAEDMQDLAGVQPFALTTEDLPKYNVTYLSKEKIDEINAYVFDVKPKQFVKGDRYFQGRVWVDDQDLQIVKVAGQAVPEVGDQKFPHFESYRENIDGRYWFPTYVYADDVLNFKKAPPVHMKMIVKYSNYKRFGGRIRIGDEGEVAPDADSKSGDKSKPKPPAKPPVKPPQR